MLSRRPHKLISSLMVVLLAVAFVTPRALASLSSCRCAHGDCESVETSGDEIESSCSHCCHPKSTSDSDPQNTSADDQEQPAGLPTPCDCPAYCCSGKVVTLTVSLEAALIMQPVEQCLVVAPLTIHSLNYHAEILRPPRF
jgi:hypothetical protein